MHFAEEECGRQTPSQDIISERKYLFPSLIYSLEAVSQPLSYRVSERCD
jgi:hypothetical protein